MRSLRPWPLARAEKAGAGGDAESEDLPVARVLISSALRDIRSMRRASGEWFAPASRLIWDISAWAGISCFYARERWLVPIARAIPPLSPLVRALSRPLWFPADGEGCRPPGRAFPLNAAASLPPGTEIPCRQSAGTCPLHICDHRENSSWQSLYYSQSECERACGWVFRRGKAKARGRQVKGLQRRLGGKDAAGLFIFRLRIV